MTSRELTVPEIEKLNRDQATTEREFWRRLRRHARRIPFADQLLAAYYCAIDPATPLRARAMLYGAIALTRMPLRARSRAAGKVRPTIPALEAA